MFVGRSPAQGVRSIANPIGGRPPPWAALNHEALTTRGSHPRTTAQLNKACNPLKTEPIPGKDTPLFHFRRLILAPIREAKTTGKAPKEGLGHIYIAIARLNSNLKTYIAGPSGMLIADSVRAAASELVVNGGESDMAIGELSSAPHAASCIARTSSELQHRNPRPATRDPRPATRDLRPATLNLQPATRKRDAAAAHRPATAASG